MTGESKKMTKEVEEQVRPMLRQVAQQFLMSWTINKALYAKYGGRVIFQQTGAEPIDAYRDFLRDQEKSGRFQINDKQYESGFWRYFTSDTGYKFAKKEDGAKLINAPWLDDGSTCRRVRRNSIQRSKFISNVLYSKHEVGHQISR